MKNRQAAFVGGTVIDGTGTGAYPGTVIVSNGRVLDILGQQNSIPSDAEIFDCTGLTIAPGFIDTHSHADNAPFLLEDDVSKIEQGVTTEVTGNCGFSLAPIEPMNREAAHTLLSRIFPPTELPWGRTAELFDAMDDKGLVTNHAPLVGHNVLRIAAMGAEGRHADRYEVQRMVAALESALDAGAFGLSSGLIYPPGLFSDSSELGALTEVLGKKRVYATHMRNESSRVFESISESLSAVGKRCRLHVSHVKIADSMQWGRMNEIMAALDDAREKGQSVYQDAYPYSAGSTMLTAALPPWFHDGGEPSVLARLESPEALRQARFDMENDRSYENMVIGGWDKIVVSSTSSHRFEGESITHIADRMGVEPFNALVKVLREEQLKATMIVHFMHENDVRTALTHPFTAIGSDGLPPGTGGRPHPRTYGTFPRILGHYARDEGLMTVEEAVRRITQLPAEIFGITDRGVIRRGAVADLVTFDPTTITDTATYQDPINRPRGIDSVFHEGIPVVRHGIWQGTRRGRRLSAA